VNIAKRDKGETESDEEGCSGYNCLGWIGGQIVGSAGSNRMSFVLCLLGDLRTCLAS